MTHRVWWRTCRPPKTVGAPKGTEPRPELLISAKVGLADSWAKQWRKGQGVTDEDKELAAKVDPDSGHRSR